MTFSIFEDNGVVHWAIHMYPDLRRTLCGKGVHDAAVLHERCYYLNEVRKGEKNPANCFECNLEYMELRKRVNSE